jgi:hypothetical protein
LYAIGIDITTDIAVFTIVLHGPRQVAVSNRQAPALVVDERTAFDNGAGFRENGLYYE